MHGQQLSDQQIIDLVINGDVDAFGELVARYQIPVIRLAYSLLTNIADAEDISQEVFIKVYNHLDTYTDDGRFWGWLRRITLNICIRHVQSTKPVYIDDLDYIADEKNSGACESIIYTEDLKKLRKLISQLPLAYRSVIVLKYLEEMSYSEIAEILGENTANIQTRMCRAKKMLREGIQVE